MKKLTKILGLTVMIYLLGWFLFCVGLRWAEKSKTPRVSEPVSVSRHLPASAVDESMGASGSSGAPPKEEPLINRPKPSDPILSPCVFDVFSNLPTGRAPDNCPDGTILSEYGETRTDGHLSRPAIPAGRIPSGVFLSDKITCTGCWDIRGLETSGPECDELNGLRTAFEQRLYIIERCRKNMAGEKVTGHLDLGMEIDFSTGQVSYWNIASSNLRHALEITACVDEYLDRLPLTGANPLHVRYQYELGVRFGRPITPAAAIERREEKRLAERIESGRSVAVIRDRVRVRRSPEDGQILGKISSGNRVLLLSQQDEWCRVRTPRGNIGWMVCWSLDL